MFSILVMGAYSDAIKEDLTRTSHRIPWNLPILNVGKFELIKGLDLSMVQIVR